MQKQFLSDITRKLLLFEITKMLIAVLKKLIYCVIYYNFLHTFVPYWCCLHNMRSRVYVTVERPSVCPISSGGRRFVAEGSSGRRYRSVSAQALISKPAARRSAANVSSVTLSAKGGGWTQTCFVCNGPCLEFLTLFWHWRLGVKVIRTADLYSSGFRFCPMNYFHYMLYNP